MKLDILAFGAHPDDVELSCAGTLLSQIKKGNTVGLIDLTRGELGTRGTAEIRDKEAAASAEKMGAKVRENLNLGDGFFQHTNENILKCVEMIRKYQPDIVLANALEDRHPDHGKGAKLVAEACFFAGLQKIETVHNGKKQEKWRPKNIYHYIQDRHLKPDFIVDVSPFVEKKFELILTYRSQFFLPEADEYKEELQTPISGKDFMDFMKAKMAVFGRPAGYSFAEGFQFSKTPGVKNLFDLV